MKFKLAFIIFLLGILQLQSQSTGCETLAAQVTSMSCGPNGTAMINLTGGSRGYQGPGRQVALGYFFVEGLDIGTHTLTFTDSEGCTVQVTFIIKECCKDFKADLWSLTCGPNGTAKVWVSGGVAPYIGPGTQVGISGNFAINGLSVGTHTLTFTDSKGCKVEVTFYMPECGCEDLKAQVTSKSCGPNGSATIRVTGGSQGYQGPGNQVALGYFLINGLSVGTHTLTFTDSEGCEVEVTFTIEECNCDDLIAQVKSKSCGPNGSVNISVTGGVAPYVGPGTQVGIAGNFVINGLSVGTHTLTFKDSKGCEVDVTFTIVDCCINFKADLWSLSCGPNGTAKVWVSGGVAPYVGPGTQVGIAGNFVINGLSVGTHTLTFTDSKGCKVEVTFYMPECGCEDLKAQVTSVTCGSNSTAAILITEGSAPYTTTYSGPHFQIGGPGNFLIQGLAVGTHTLTFIDSEGCEIEVRFTVYDNNNFKAKENGIFGCAPNGGVRIELTGGTAPYSGPGEMVTPNAFVISGLGAGDHTFVYTDNNGCEEEVTVTIQDALEIASIITGDSNCSGTGSATITLTGGIAPYRFGVTISNTGIFYVDDLPYGANSLVFFDDAGCLVTAEFIIEHDGSGDCEQFTFERDEEDNISNDLYQETFVSEISATIYVALDAFGVPDELLVTVNGNEVVSFSSGSHPCDGPSPEVVIDSFCVSFCDVVEFKVFGDICPLGNTVWDLKVTCKENCGLDLLYDSSSNISNRSNSNRSTDRYFEELRLNSIHTAKVFPNPAFDVLNIANIDPWFGYEDVRIINSTGKVVHNENVSNLDQINIDLRSFPNGLYIIEMTDKSGYIYTEKFMKLD